ncbi:uncharacterized protein LOC128549997 [Mercenaria mercenaria]|uniref:uncharacterized protein LOC128549997 n=1 Tax=Mercenaria mercenaria TaxID=6596 RepID=UPI00234F9C4D|nr:uncharacterized protein LOC128549997 [Mercenaria mercenaria]
MTMEITPERLEEITKLITIWLEKETASLKEVQQLLGKLNFIGACVKPSRIFVSRLLNWLRELYERDALQQSHIPSEVKKDLLWWNEFLSLYNGVSLMSLGDWSEPDQIFSSDSCLESCGGYWEGNYFHVQFPVYILDKNLHIGALEMLSLVVCLHLWGSNFKHRRIIVLCDNLSVCIALNTGKARCSFLQSCLREVCFIAAINEFEIRAQHILTSENRIADCLSRWHKNDSYQKQFFALVKDENISECTVVDNDFEFKNNW